MSLGTDSLGTVPLESDAVVAAISGNSVNPTAGNVVVTGYAPVITQGASQTISPTTASLTVTGFAPTVTVGAGQTISPGVGALTVTGYAPQVIQTAGAQTLSPSTGQMTVTGYAPRVIQLSAQNSGGYGYAELPRIDRKKSVQQEREELGIIQKKVQKVITEVAKRSVNMIKTDEQAIGLLRNALDEQKIPNKDRYLESFAEKRDKMLQTDIARALLIRQRNKELQNAEIQRQQDAEDEEFSAEMLLL
jgi:hypothetical protein